MLQRIQSLYLIGTVLVQVLISQFAFLFFTRNDVNYSLTVLGVSESNGTSIVLDYKQVIIVVLACVFAIISISIYKNRKLQIKLTKLIVFICLAQLGFVAVSAYQLSKGDFSNMGIGVATLLIPLCAILAILAGKAIKKDEDLIKSVDRIR